MITFFLLMKIFFSLHTKIPSLLRRQPYGHTVTILRSNSITKCSYATPHHPLRWKCSSLIRLFAPTQQRTHWRGAEAVNKLGRGKFLILVAILATSVTLRTESVNVAKIATSIANTFHN